MINNIYKGFLMHHPTLAVFSEGNTVTVAFQIVASMEYEQDPADNELKSSHDTKESGTPSSPIYLGSLDNENSWLQLRVGPRNE